ncbi:MAG TPA: hypothetical protein DEA26_02685 [Oceanospirillales bacterium]|nr:hypothetical protein [Oceanospirillaceae bacterium]HBS41561.1 hypothetical protein [Oceanospirillales bacterium]|tara:strand:+ start:27665 stop:28702 length:1038 start_codon:yes stop_codon:yes gene_type:complete
MANIVICADGTWNRPEEDLSKDYPTNVLKMARAITPEQGDVKQHVFYDWGLGSYHDKMSAGMTGSGIHKNILDGYRYIVQNYNEGDRIYLFGFSRGAYTVRALSGLINNCGILKRAEARLISEAWKIYKSPSKKNHPSGEAAVEFRKQFCQPSRDVHFIGVWDTVGALGIPFSLMGLFDSHDEFYDTKMGSNVKFARHALSIDEEREDFAPTVWTPRPGVNLKQVWFSGCHGDIGGGNEPDSKTGYQIADTALAWMMGEARMTGLHLEPHLSQNLTDGMKGSIHKSRKHVYRLKRPLHRDLTLDGKPTLIHPSVKQRYESDSKYRPKRLVQLVEKLGWDGMELGA